MIANFARFLAATSEAPSATGEIIKIVRDYVAHMQRVQDMGGALDCDAAVASAAHHAHALYRDVSLSAANAPVRGRARDSSAGGGGGGGGGGTVSQGRAGAGGGARDQSGVSNGASGGKKRRTKGAAANEPEGGGKKRAKKEGTSSKQKKKKKKKAKQAEA